MSRLVKLEPSCQTRSVANFAQTVMQPAHNADFWRLRISKTPANARKTKYFLPGWYFAIL
ncbi:hypothetical protein DWY47_10035, partial [Ruminococcus sp. AF25-23LB]